MKSRRLAPPARLELTTSRLGGARSIQVSYGGICVPMHFTEKNESCQHNPLQILDSASYNMGNGLRGGNMVNENETAATGIADLLYDADTAYPSER